ncbi:InlB B-repeat-containing protein [Lacrimispora sp. 210928-DFI.3.58]|uniref:InlB B-repeat-containing protein n=1 Tax=Lacrimispora sp. 210928-DFI.3.58 TaxID=2883214 RepID=UPI0015B45221|nr:InlB B-repeat-containing protein [Lacrimispora sp. 210928-DFI.3.58]MCB7320895.1 InlB B-repeat-containing protein [Lacrimispora sp. 210928-DFI.3.58]
MEQKRGAKGMSHKKPRTPLRKRMKVIGTYLLLVSLLFGSVNNSMFDVFGGQAAMKEEFCIHADDLKLAAAEALDSGQPMEESLEFECKDKSLLNKYEQLFAADGRLYEIFPEYTRTYEVDDIDLRVFLRIAEDADPETYALTGEEELIFLYVNGGEEAVSGRVNIDGLVSGNCTLKAYETVFGEKDGTVRGNTGSAGSGSRGPGAGSGSLSAGTGITETGAAEAGSNPGGSAGNETEAGVLPGETNETSSGQEGNAGLEPSDGTPEEGEKGEVSDKPDSNPENGGSQAGDSGASGTEGSAGGNSGSIEDSGSGTEAGGVSEGSGEIGDGGVSEGSGETGDSEAAGGSGETGDSGTSEGSSETGDGGASGESSESGDSSTSGEGSSGDSGTSDGGSDASEDSGSNEEGSQLSMSLKPIRLLAVSADTMVELAEDEKEAAEEEYETEAESEEETDVEPEEETEEEPAEETGAGTGKETEAETGGDAASEPETEAEFEPETKPGDSSEPGTESEETETGNTSNQEPGAASESGEAPDESGTDQSTARPADLSYTGDAVAHPDVKVELEEEVSFDRRGILTGETYNLAALDQTVTARAFTVTFSQLGLDKEYLEAEAHIIDYLIDPVGSAELVKAPKLVRDGAQVAFGIVPQAGYAVMEVTANGEELEEIEVEDIITETPFENVYSNATPSEAVYSNATPSDAVDANTGSSSAGSSGTFRTDAVYYQIPEVLEDQEVEIFLEEIVPGTHPAFHYAKTINGVTVTVSTEEGILPEGTKAVVEEVTSHVEEAVKEKVEQENTEAESTEVTSVLAYDITLYDADGNKLDDSWSNNGYVNVSFTGAPIEEKSKEADSVEIMHLDTDADVRNEEIASGEVSELDRMTETVSVPGEENITEIAFDAQHFSTYTVVFKRNNWNSSTLSIHVVDTAGTEIGEDNRYTYSNVSSGNSYSVETIAAEIVKGLPGYVFEKATTDKAGNKPFTEFYYVSSGGSNGLYLTKTTGWLGIPSYSNPITEAYFWFKKDNSTVIFDPNTAQGGIGAPVERNMTDGNRTLPEPEEIGISHKDEWIFAGWSTDSSGQGKVYIAGIEPDESIIKSGTRLYAIWFDPNGKDNNTAYFYIRKDGEIQYEPGGYGQKFYYPSDTDAGEQQYELHGKLKTPVAVNNDLEKVAQNLQEVPTDKQIQEVLSKYNVEFDPDTQEIVWYVIKFRKAGTDGTTLWNVDGVIRDKNKYELKYDPNGGSINVPGSNEYAEGTDVDINFEKIPTRSGYEFLGWDENKDAATPIYIKGQEPTTIKMPDHDVTLYAIWQNKLSTLSGTKIWSDGSNEHGTRPEISTGVPLELTKTVNGQSSVVTGVSPTWTIVSDNEWKWEYLGLPEYEGDYPITYSVKEVIDPSDRYEASQTGNEITNTLKTGTFEISKKLEDISLPNENYSKVKFQIYKANQDWNYAETDTMLSSPIAVDKTSGLVCFDNLFDGRYVIVETNTAPGYQIVSDIQLEVSWDSGTYVYKVNGEPVEGSSYEIINYKGTELPETGGPGTEFLKGAGWTMITVSAALAGFDIMKYFRRRQEI